MAGFRAAAEEFERLHGKMSNDELRQFKAEWKKANGLPENSGSRHREDPRDVPVDRRQAYVNDAYKSAGAKFTGIKEWLSKVGDRMAPGDEHERNRKERILERAVEHMGNKLNHLLTGASMTERLLPEYGGDETYDETVDFNFPGRKGSETNPVRLESQHLGMPTNSEQGIEEIPKEVGKARFRKGSHENPIRLDPVYLPDDRGLSPDDGLRTEEVTIKVPPKRVAKR